jgi:rhodanese-related sulfurtransferase
MKRTILFILIAGSALLAACSNAAVPTEASIVDPQGQKVAVEGGTYTDVSVTEFQAMMENKDFTFVNVHIPYAGDIPNTDLSIPFNEIETNLNQLPVDKDAKIVVYCRSGSMSSMAAKDLVQLGYTNVRNLSGGMVAWESAGFPMDD